MRVHNVKSVSDLGGKSKGEVFADLAGSHDCALPQGWLDAFAKFCEAYRPGVTYHLILSSTVWNYVDGWSGPVTCCSEVASAWESWTREYIHRPAPVVRDSYA